MSCLLYNIIATYPCLSGCLYFARQNVAHCLVFFLPPRPSLPRPVRRLVLRNVARRGLPPTSCHLRALRCGQEHAPQTSLCRLSGQVRLQRLSYVASDFATRPTSVDSPACFIASARHDAQPSCGRGRRERLLLRLTRQVQGAHHPGRVHRACSVLRQLLRNVFHDRSRDPEIGQEMSTGYRGAGKSP